MDHQNINVFLQWGNINERMIVICAGNIFAIQNHFALEFMIGQQNLDVCFNCWTANDSEKHCLPWNVWEKHSA